MLFIKANYNSNHDICLCNENQNVGHACQVNIETMNEKDGKYTVGILEVKRILFKSEKNIKSILTISSNLGVELIN